LNLVINAAHAIAEASHNGADGKGVITIRTRYDGPYAEIRVEDTGTGIAEDIRPRVFDLFFTTKEVGRGTGQGLALAHAIVVDKHGGTIDFETEVGRGTTFVVRLPVDGRPESRAADALGEERAATVGAAVALPQPQNGMAIQPPPQQCQPAAYQG
jgi:signal transduction histidine kinase